MKLKTCILSFIIICSHYGFAQLNNYGTIKITLEGEKASLTQDGYPFAFADITAYTDSLQIKGTADIEGQCTIKPLKPGKYNVKVVQKYYQTVIAKNINVSADKICYLKLFLTTDSTNTKAPKIIEYTSPAINTTTQH